MAAWIDNRDYERRPQNNWVVPVVTLSLLFLLGLVLIRPSQTANQENFGGQAGVGGGPPTSEMVQSSSTPTPTPRVVNIATPTPTRIPTPTVMVLPTY